MACGSCQWPAGTIGCCANATSPPPETPVDAAPQSSRLVGERPSSMRTLEWLRPRRSMRVGIEPDWDSRHGRWRCPGATRSAMRSRNQHRVATSTSTCGSVVTDVEHYYGATLVAIHRVLDIGWRLDDGALRAHGLTSIQTKPILIDLSDLLIALSIRSVRRKRGHCVERARRSQLPRDSRGSGEPRKARPHCVAYVAVRGDG